MACKINVTLPSGFSMPALGLGTWQAFEREIETALDSALETGYRHIDTAWVYENEQAIGNTLKKWLDAGKVKREELFIVTKLPMYGNRPSDVALYLNGSLEKLQLSYVDLYLFHAPFGIISKENREPDFTTDIVAIWKEMEKQVDCRKARAIGISNFNIKQVQKILDNARIPPVTNQIEFHAYLQQPELVQFLKKNNIIVTAYSPLGSIGSAKFFNERGVNIEIPNLFEDEKVQKIAKKHGKTPAQVLLRHIVQNGMVAIPKSTNPKRMKENMDIFNFELDPVDMKTIDGLDRNIRVLMFSKFFNGLDKHPEYPFNV